VANKRRSGARAERLALIADDLALDMTERQIAERHGISKTQARNDILEIKADWLASRNEALDQARAQQSARLVRFIREMWEAWFDSKGLQIKLFERQKPGSPVFSSPDPGIVIDGAFTPDVEQPGEMITTSISKQSFYSSGNYKYAEMILGAYDQLAKVNGLYAAKEVHLNVKRYLENVASEIGIDIEDLMREFEEVAEAEWNRTEAKL
jgi:hypothetical protein